MINTRCSIITAVGGDGGMSNSTAGTSFRRRGSARRATTRRDGLALTSSSQSGQQWDQEGRGSTSVIRVNREEQKGINYAEIKKLIDRQQLYNKKGRLTESEIKTLVDDWHDKREEDSINQETLDRETRSMEKALNNYNVEQLGDIPTEREDGAIRI
jgi:hypothetical protein